MSRPFAVVDTETTGLDPRIHQPFEVCVWAEASPVPFTFQLAHSLEFADPRALEINHYHERGMAPFMHAQETVKTKLATMLTGVTLVGANPAFDAAMLTRFLGFSPWHHRLTNISEAARWVFGWPQQEGLADVIATLVRLGYEIPAPDHTAEGDVRATRAAYEALVEIRSKLGPVQ